MPTIIVMAPGWKQKIEVALRPYLLGATADIADDIRANLSEAGNVDTGHLLDSVNQSGRTVRIGTDHWHYIEFGTRPHIIRAVHKKALANNRQVFGKTVFHPGTREYAPIRRAVYKKRRLSKLGGAEAMVG